MAGSMSMWRRVAALETTKRNRDRRAITIPLIAAKLGETSAEAVARYVAINGPLEEVDEGDVNIIVMVPVAPKERPVA